MRLTMEYSRPTTATTESRYWFGFAENLANRYHFRPTRFGLRRCHTRQQCNNQKCGVHHRYDIAIGSPLIHTIS
jgi:hypothetical protein